MQNAPKIGIEETRDAIVLALDALERAHEDPNLIEEAQNYLFSALRDATLVWRMMVAAPCQR